MGQINTAISTARSKHSSIENTEVVGKVFLRTLRNNICEAERMFCPCGTVLNFNSDWFSEFVRSGYPVNATDELCTLWELELTREGGLDMDSTFIHFRTKSIFWQMQLEPIIHPLKALGSPSIGEGCVANDLDAMQVAYNRWRELTSNVYIQIRQESGR